MKDVEEFVKQCVTIDYKEEHKIFGYFPFNMFVEKNDGSVDFVCIATTDGGVLNVYKIMFKYISSGVEKLYLAIDFPAGMDMKNDFVCVIQYDRTLESSKKFDLFAIPYNDKTGEVYERITSSPHLNMILMNIVIFAKQYK